MVYLIRLDQEDNHGTYYYDDGCVEDEYYKTYQYITDYRFSISNPIKNKKFCYLYITNEGEQVASVFTKEEFKKVKDVDMVECIFNMDSLIELPLYEEED